MNDIFAVWNFLGFKLFYLNAWHMSFHAVLDRKVSVEKSAIILMG
jgi:hypothetical protein